ncbi:hypothetical protein [Vibrio cholerae]|uniref:hypothetical protein n=1 Tax=Vibrio cholerae TaxID=666 RepID=UPI000BA9BC9A|nr:hypothetical protein [Vibrio cholerae]EGQ8411293.1 hypothetical protein [Vibrio cholerae]EHY8704845.1 hypothetical protein [Vibrio cholerae]PAS36519.1 hypothetical protein CGT70_14625 [Vibrio cholerae]PAS40206.1 hypothetical protein CGT69_15610 [Vibrio cholerae]PAS45730.1 hypothetical protein CGT68_04365 [Vibrio cholerae]
MAMLTLELIEIPAEEGEVTYAWYLKGAGNDVVYQITQWTDGGTDAEQAALNAYKESLANEELASHYVYQEMGLDDAMAQRAWNNFYVDCDQMFVNDVETLELGEAIANRFSEELVEACLEA